MSPTQGKQTQPSGEQSTASQKPEASQSAKRRTIPEENLPDEDQDFFENSLKRFMQEPLHPKEEKTP